MTADREVLRTRLIEAMLGEYGQGNSIGEDVERMLDAALALCSPCQTCGGTGKEPICSECGGPNGTHDMSCGGFYAADLPCPTCRGAKSCLDCKTPLPLTGERGRPRVRCESCQAKRRKRYLRMKQRERRAKDGTPSAAPSTGREPKP